MSPYGTISGGMTSPGDYPRSGYETKVLVAYVHTATSGTGNYERQRSELLNDGWHVSSDLLSGDKLVSIFDRIIPPSREEVDAWWTRSHEIMGTSGIVNTNSSKFVSEDDGSEFGE
jgi:hypothetical protein